MTLSEFPILLQQDNVDCGPTCLRMICHYFGRNFSVRFLRELSNKRPNGVSLFDLNEAAKELGLKTLGVKLDIVKVKQAELPCIIHWRQNHFVVLHKIQNGKFYIADPARGLLTVEENGFFSKWLAGDGAEIGYVLLIKPTVKFYKVIEK
jgi:ATP-binding cassette subfamily B protein